MKKIIYFTLFSLLVLSSFWSYWSVSASAPQTSKQSVMELPAGDKIVKRVDEVVKKIVNLSKNDDTFHKKVEQKISNILATYGNKTDEKSQMIVTIFTYLQEELHTQMNTSSSRVLDRLKQVESDKNKNRASSRVMKIKQKKYQRIHVKK